MFNFKKVTHLPLISEEYNLLPKGLTKKENYTKRKVLNTFGLRKSGSTEGTLHLSDFEMITKSRFNKERLSKQSYSGEQNVLTMIDSAHQVSEKDFYSIKG